MKIFGCWITGAGNYGQIFIVNCLLNQNDLILFFLACCLVYHGISWDFIILYERRRKEGEGRMGYKCHRYRVFFQVGRHPKDDNRIPPSSRVKLITLQSNVRRFNDVVELTSS